MWRLFDGVVCFVCVGDIVLLYDWLKHTVRPPLEVQQGLLIVSVLWPNGQPFRDTRDSPRF